MIRREESRSSVLSPVLNFLTLISIATLSAPPGRLIAPLCTLLVASSVCFVDAGEVANARAATLVSNHYSRRSVAQKAHLCTWSSLFVIQVQPTVASHFDTEPGALSADSIEQ